MRNGKVLCILSGRCYSYFLELHESLVVMVFCGVDVSSLMCAVVMILHACCELLVGSLSSRRYFKCHSRRNDPKWGIL